MTRYMEILKWARIDPISQYNSDPIVDVEKAQDSLNSINNLHRKYLKPPII